MAPSVPKGNWDGKKFQYVFEKVFKRKDIWLKVFYACPEDLKNNAFFSAGTWEGQEAAARHQPSATPEPVTPHQPSATPEPVTPQQASTPKINYKKKVEELLNELQNTKNLLEKKRRRLCQGCGN